MDFVIDDTVSTVLGSLMEHGYDVQGDDHVRDVALIVESIKAAMYRSRGMHHGLHTVSNKINIRPQMVETDNSAIREI